jgi:MFS transporter, DHA1 family, multidrug resistance protein
VVEEKGWRWTQWTVLFFFVASFLPIFFVHETYKKTIVQRRGLSPSEPGRSFMQGFRYFITKTVLRPVHMLATEPIVGFVCLYTSFQFALLYTFVVASPFVFMTVYKFSLPSLAGHEGHPLFFSLCSRPSASLFCSSSSARLPCSIGTR